MRNLLFVIALLAYSQVLFGNTLSIEKKESYLETISLDISSKLSDLDDTLTKKEFNTIKVTAVALAVTLGVFGIHRLYLGTKPNVPIVYTLTLGGGFFLLPLIDIIYIIAAKDINQLKNNDYIFIWNKKKKN
jgi:TM2 domain-containing membrane protein YozV